MDFTPSRLARFIGLASLLAPLACGMAPEDDTTGARDGVEVVRGALVSNKRVITYNFSDCAPVTRTSVSM